MQIVTGNDDGGETQFLSLSNALLNTADGTYLTRKTHFARHAKAMVNGSIHIATEDGGNDGQVNGGVVHPKATGNVEKDILLRQLEPHALLQHGQQHVHAPGVEPRSRTLWSTIGSSAHQCLCLDEERTYPLDGAGYGYTTHPLVLATEQEFAGVAHLTETILTHFIDAQFGRRAKAVLDAPQDTVHVVLVALKLDYRIHDVLQYLGTCQCALLIDMSDENHRCTRLLGKFQDGSRTLTNLRDASR